jgi:hypothetical protein
MQHEKCSLLVNILTVYFEGSIFQPQHPLLRGRYTTKPLRSFERTEDFHDNFAGR